MSAFPSEALKGVGTDLSAAASSAAKEIRNDVEEVAKIFKGEAAEDKEKDDAHAAHSALITRTNADAMNASITSSLASGGSGNVLLSGMLKKRDGLVVKKWVDVYVELRENSLTCFGSASKTQILDTLVIDAGIEFVFTEKDKLPALILKKSSARGPLAKELVLGAETQSQRDQWAETLDACCLKARSHVEAKKMVQEEAAARARKEAELQRKALEDAARSRQQVRAAQGATGAVESATFALDELDNAAAPPSTPLQDGEKRTSFTPPSHLTAPMTPSPADQQAAGSVLQPSTPAHPPDGKRGGRMSFMGSRMRSAFANVPAVSLRGVDTKDGGAEEEDQGQGQAQLEESMKDVMLAEANHRLRQMQEELQKEKDQTAKLRDQVHLLVSEDQGLQEMQGRMEAAEEAARRAEESADTAKRGQAEAQGELEELRKAAAAAAEKKASEAAARDLRESREEDEEEAAQRLLVSLKQEVVRLQEEVVSVEKAAKASVENAEQRAAAAEHALAAAVERNSVSGGDPSVLPASAPSKLHGVPSIATAPGSIQEFCENCGLEKYAELMIDNEVDLDVLTDLADEDWEELGVAAGDLPCLLDAVERLRKAQEEGLGVAGNECSNASTGDAGGAAGAVARMEEVEKREQDVLRRELAAAENENNVEKLLQDLRQREDAVLVVEQSCAEKVRELEAKEALLESRERSQELSGARLEEREREVAEESRAAVERERQVEGREREVLESRQSLDDESRKLDARKQELEAAREQAEKEIEQARREVEDAKKDVEAAKKGIGVRELSADLTEARAPAGVSSPPDLSAKIASADEEREKLLAQLAESAANLERVTADAQIREEASMAAMRELRLQASCTLEQVRGLYKESTKHFALKLQVLHDGMEEITTEVAALQHGCEASEQLQALRNRLVLVEAEAARERERVEEEAQLERHALEERLAALEADHVKEREDRARSREDPKADAEVGTGAEATGAGLSAVNSLWY